MLFSCSYEYTVYLQPSKVESEWTLGVGDGQGDLVCCDSWGRKELDTTEWLNWTELKVSFINNLHNVQDIWDAELAEGYKDE